MLTCRAIWSALQGLIASIFQETTEIPWIFEAAVAQMMRASSLAKRAAYVLVRDLPVPTLYRKTIAEMTSWVASRTVMSEDSTVSPSPPSIWAGFSPSEQSYDCSRTHQKISGQTFHFHNLAHVSSIADKWSMAKFLKKKCSQIFAGCGCKKGKKVLGCLCCLRQSATFAVLEDTRWAVFLTDCRITMKTGTLAQKNTSWD